MFYLTLDCPCGLSMHVVIAILTNLSLRTIYGQAFSLNEMGLEKMGESTIIYLISLACSSSVRADQCWVVIVVVKTMSGNMTRKDALTFKFHLS